MATLRSRTLPALACIVAVLVASSCGEDGEPRPGATDPCHTAAAGVLGCAANIQATPGGNDTLDVQQACRKLVNCGVLAGELLNASGTGCAGDADCGTGECLPNKDGTPVCFYHALDYQWCVSRLVGDTNGERCGSGGFQQAEVDAALRCISRTDCAALGAPFDLKARSRSSRPDIDKYTCNDGSSKYTATVCDAGLLSY
ncbi:MAG: hypothetical protein KC503_04545 [Myxococcales bacterium]|nr:hypothetical protein [Myxococcales bacterium]